MRAVTVPHLPLPAPGGGSTPITLLEESAVKKSLPFVLALVAVALAVSSGSANPRQDPQDKYSLKVPGGLAFSEFKGYEDWQVVAVSQTEDLLKVMVANPTMVAAYRAGVPLNGAAFPDGSKIAKIEWHPKKSTESPFAVRIPAGLQDVFLIEKDTKRFPETKGWAYAVFDYDATAPSKFKPNPTGTVNCGFACHTIVAKKDYIFTEYGTR